MSFIDCASVSDTSYIEEDLTKLISSLSGLQTLDKINKIAKFLKHIKKEARLVNCLTCKNLKASILNINLIRVLIESLKIN